MPDDIKSVKYSLVKMSLDARNKEKITYNYVVNVEVDNEAEILKACKKSKTISQITEKKYQLPKQGSEKIGREKEETRESAPVAGDTGRHRDIELCRSGRLYMYPGGKGGNRFG